MKIDASVIITTKNRMNFLKRAVQSVIDNDGSIEIIIVNDGGVPFELDDLKISSEFCIKIVNNANSMGANYSRNIGVEHASSEYLFFLDDDDAFTKDSISSRLSIFSSYNDVGLVYTGISLVKASNLHKIQRSNYPVLEGDVYENLLKDGNLIGSTSRVAVKRSIFYESGKFDEDLASLQDYDLWLRICQLTKVKHDSSCNVFYTVHDDGNQISSRFITHIESGRKIYEKHYSAICYLNLRRRFYSNIYLRVSLSAATSSVADKIFYSWKSLCLYPSLKALVILLLPYRVLKKIRYFV